MPPHRLLSHRSGDALACIFVILVEWFEVAACGHFRWPVAASSHASAVISHQACRHCTSMLESGEMPFDKPGRHRRVRLADLLAYQQRSRRGRAALLDQMVADSEEAGLYDLPGDAPFERLPASDDQRPE